MRLIGVDWSTNPRGVGIARGTRDSVDAVEVGVSRGALEQKIAAWLPASGPALVCIDAPLGWPQPLGAFLGRHRAGKAIPVPPNELFRRETDRFVKAKVGKQPLDVGADRIARTAWSALDLLAAVRGLKKSALPLAWCHCHLSIPSVIEVYPAATLKAHSLQSTGYKGPDAGPLRARIARGVARLFSIEPAHRKLIRSNADALDAVVCLLAGRDFRTGDALLPENLRRAKREGWIWVVDPERADCP